MGEVSDVNKHERACKCAYTQYLIRVAKNSSGTIERYLGFGRPDSAACCAEIDDGISTSMSSGVVVLASTTSVGGGRMQAQPKRRRMKRVVESFVEMNNCMRVSEVLGSDSRFTLRTFTHRRDVGEEW